MNYKMHQNRTEHWTVVSGAASVTNRDKDTLLTDNQQIYIPIGVIHALENPGKSPLELIELNLGHI